MAKPKAEGQTAPGAQLVRMIAQLREEEALKEIKKLLASDSDPLEVLKWCNKGMLQVGERYEKGSYYMASLIMAGEIMRQATELLTPYLGEHREGEKPVAKALVATVQGDIHDLGKNIFALMLRCNGFAVTDLGVDVPAEELIARVGEGRYDVVGLSVTMTSGLEELKRAVALLKALPAPRPGVIIGGAVVDDHVQKYVNADAWAPDANSGAKICVKLVSGKPGA